MNDKRDNQSFNGGLRLSYLVVNDTDAILTAEASASFHYISDANAGKPQSRRLYEGAFVFQELYNPVAFRVALGGGMEHRQKEWSTLILYRGGLGWYATSSLGLWFDLVGRNIVNLDSKPNREIHVLASPLELTLSTQIIF